MLEVGNNNILNNYQFDNTKDLNKFKKSLGNDRKDYKKGNTKKKEDEAIALTFMQLNKAYYICRDPKYFANNYYKRSKIE